MTETPAGPVDTDAIADGRARRGWWRRRWVWLAALVGGAAIVAGAALVPGSRSARPVAKGAAPAFSLPDVRHADDRVALSDFHGRPVVVNFWASWCVPCRREMPALERAHRKFGRQVAFVGIDHEDARTDAVQFLKETGVTYPSGYDPDGKTATAYGLLGVPTTVFVAANGQIVGRHTGELSEQTLDEEIRRDFPSATS